MYRGISSGGGGGKRFLASGWRLASLFAVVSMVTIALASGPLARGLLTSDEHSTAVMLAGVAVAWLVRNIVILSAINSAGEMVRVLCSSSISQGVAFASCVPSLVDRGSQ